jgi:hypothetical protein
MSGPSRNVSWGAASVASLCWAVRPLAASAPPAFWQEAKRSLAQESDSHFNGFALKSGIAPVAREFAVLGHNPSINRTTKKLRFLSAGYLKRWAL